MWAQFSDVQDAFEDDIPDTSTGWVITLIGRTERLLTSKVSGIQTRIDAGDLDPMRVVDAVVAAVCRVVRNPKGLLLETEGNYSYQADRLVSSGRLFIDPDDLAALRPATSYPTAPFTSRVPASRRLA